MNLSKTYTEKIVEKLVPTPQYTLTLTATEAEELIFALNNRVLTPFSFALAQSLKEITEHE